jgi:bifunctional UDP-N-acetylglucosamine pyrophosphorylase / glucosamine-1-phosphate N-acetyltransferase
VATSLAAVVMAAGLGTRMKSEVPKHLHPLLGRRMVDWVLEAARPLGADPLLVITSPAQREAFGETPIAVQETPRGTGDAVAAARSALERNAGHVLVLSGDTPLLTTELLTSLVEAHRGNDAAATILAAEFDESRAYGRIVRDGDGNVRGVVEAVDATPDQLAIREMNTSIYVFDAEALWSALERLEPQNAQGELYLTDTVGILISDGRRVDVHPARDPRETDGVNTRAELAAAAAVLRERVNHAHMLAGVTIVDPQSTWIDPTVVLERDAVVHPFTVIRGQSRVGPGAEIGPHVVVVDSEVGERALVGPFCYLRPGTVLAAGAKAGTFVEIKKSRIGEGTKVPHLSYIGDAEIGPDTNIGAGAITANFPHRPGEPKGRTTIGRNVRTGVHNAFVAPVELGDDAWTAAGSVITDDVPANALAVARSRQVNKEGRGGKRGDD